MAITLLKMGRNVYVSERVPTDEYIKIYRRAMRDAISGNLGVNKVYIHG